MEVTCTTKVYANLKVKPGNYLVVTGVELTEMILLNDSNSAISAAADTNFSRSSKGEVNFIM